MAAPKIDGRILLFDLGGVVVESAGLAVLHERLPQLQPAQIQARWLASAAVGRFERGVISPDEFARAFLAEWPLQLEPTAFLREFASWVRGFLPGAARLLAHLRRRHTVACLSNTNAVHWAVLDEVRDAFDVCIVSHLIGHMKPERAAYAHALQRLGAEPQRVCFFDDLAPNVAAARELGLQAHQVRGVAQTEAALRGLGIAPREDV
jgi:putative hydrolase of the HAD superfamily